MVIRNVNRNVQLYLDFYKTYSFLITSGMIELINLPKFIQMYTNADLTLPPHVGVHIKKTVLKISHSQF